MLYKWLIVALLLVLVSVVLWPTATAQQGGTPPVVINEIAWAGTAASASDEWIELYNNTYQEIDLAGWTLSWEGETIHFDKTADNTREVRNSKIPAHGFYLIERGDDNTVSDIPADLIYTGSLANEGESLVLRDGRDVVIDTANGGGGAWPAGTDGRAAVPYAAMERIRSDGGDVKENWASNDGKTRNGLDAKGNPLNGTPKAKNSASGS
jgi:hypothetical protein